MTNKIGLNGTLRTTYKNYIEPPPSLFMTKIKIRVLHVVPSIITRQFSLIIQ